MTRTVDLARRADLLDRIASYVLARGIAGLSLRPLAQDVGVSPRTLLYHFESKEELVVAVLARLRDRQRERFGALRERSLATPGEICRAVWAVMTETPDDVAAMRLFFEMYAAALRDPERHPSFLADAIETWLAFLSGALPAQGDDERAFATMILAGYRGFMLDFVATGDRERVERALDLWIAAINLMSAPGGSNAC